MASLTIDGNVFNGVVYVQYWDHVQFNRADPLTVSPQIRETIGWLVYECNHYVTLKFDKDAEPPTLKSGDPKASGLVLLRTDIIEFKKLNSNQQLLKESEKQPLNCQSATNRSEYALLLKEAKNSTENIERGKYQ
jgi:hypothetical protein